MKSLANYGFILGTICVAAAGMLAMVNATTSGTIARQAKSELQAGLKDVLPANDFEERGEGSQRYWEARDANGAFLGIAFTAEGKGYSSVIETLVGMRSDSTISGVKILSQNETPGLGSQINEVKSDRTVKDLFKKRKVAENRRPWFLERFSGKSISGLESVDTITGATISSRAVIESVRRRAAEMEKYLTHE